MLYEKYRGNVRIAKRQTAKIQFSSQNKLQGVHEKLRTNTFEIKLLQINYDTKT